MTIGRSLGYDPDKVLNAAMHLFWQQGYEATSLQDLLKTMGLSKSSFYQAYGSKKELFLRCMSCYCEMFSERLKKLLVEAPSGRAFIESVLLASAGEASNPEMKRGCLLMNSATEFAQKDAAIAGRINSGLGGLKSIFAAAVSRGQGEGGISQDVDPDVLADYLVTCVGGLKTVVKGGTDAKTVHEVVGVIMRAL
jgi:TetR/AcrR family transcriptional repressor of nem operon